MRIPLSEYGYVNFMYPAGASVQHAVAITSIVAILQRSVAAGSISEGAEVLIAAQAAFGIPVAGSLKMAK